MTELETVQHAKNYLDKMAKGINPLTGEPIPEADLLNNVRLSRCLFYVSGILEKVIANGGYVGAKPKVVREAFALTEEELSGFLFSERSIPVSEIAKRLNGLKHSETMRDLSTVKITSWLVSVGILEEYGKPEGGKGKRPTPQGAALGLTFEHRTGKYGEYDVVMYSIAAQRFLIDHLDAMLSETPDAEDAR